MRTIGGRRAGTPDRARASRGVGGRDGPLAEPARELNHTLARAGFTDQLTGDLRQAKSHPRAGGIHPVGRTIAAESLKMP
jgi:hypothetical protein